MPPKPISSFSGLTTKWSGRRLASRYHNTVVVSPVGTQWDLLFDDVSNGRGHSQHPSVRGPQHANGKAHFAQTVISRHKVTGPALDGVIAPTEKSKSLKMAAHQPPSVARKLSHPLSLKDTKPRNRENFCPGRSHPVKILSKMMPCRSGRYSCPRPRSESCSPG